MLDFQINVKQDPAVDEFINNVSLALAEGGADDLILRVKNMKW